MKLNCSIESKTKKPAFINNYIRFEILLIVFIFINLL